MYTVLMECIQVYKTILSVIKMILTFLTKSAITILAVSVNPILLSCIILLLSINRYKYWRNLAYLVILGSAMGYKFLLLSKIPARYNNY